MTFFWYALKVYSKIKTKKKKRKGKKMKNNRSFVTKTSPQQNTSKADGLDKTMTTSCNLQDQTSFIDKS